MFLIGLLQKRLQSMRGNGRKSERGTALIGILGLMGASSAIAVSSVSMSVHAVGYTTSTRAGVQAQAAAEAGIDVVAASLATAICQPQYSSVTAPVFSVLVEYSTLAASPGTTDNSWVAGCPGVATAARLRLISTGRANTGGVAGNSSEDIRKVEAIYPYIPTPPSFAITPSGAALYSFAQASPTISNMTITQGSTVRPMIQYASGNVTCATGTTINGDILLGSGSLSVTSGCTINGDLWASSIVNIQSGEVTGDVNSNGEDNDAEHTGNSSVTVSQDSKVDGDVHSSGSVKIHGKVGGNVVAGPTKVHSDFSENSSVGGSVITAGTVTAASGVVKGTITTNQAGIVTPSIPLVPKWVDFSFKASDWKTASGSNYTVLTMASCNSSALNAALTAVANSATAIILDTRICGTVTNLQGRNITLKSDTVIVANGLNMGSQNLQSTDATTKRLWLVIPDSIADSAPNCGASSTTTIGNGVSVSAQVNALIYSPCAINNAGDVWRGQMYSSSVSNTASFTLSYVPVGLPGVNLSTGLTATLPGTGTLGDRISMRNISV